MGYRRRLRLLRAYLPGSKKVCVVRHRRDRHETLRWRGMPAPRRQPSAAKPLASPSNLRYPRSDSNAQTPSFSANGQICDPLTRQHRPWRLRAKKRAGDVLIQPARERLDPVSRRRRMVSPPILQPKLLWRADRRQRTRPVPVGRVGLRSLATAAALAPSTSGRAA